MVKWAGHTLAAMGVLHGVMSVVLFGDLLIDIWVAGPLAGLSWSLGMLAAFWFAIFTWLMIVLGLVIAGIGKDKGDFRYRRLTGWSFILMPVLCGIFLPVSGLWAFILPGIMLLRPVQAASDDAPA